jgi:hypothetical protein
MRDALRRVEAAERQRVAGRRALFLRDEVVQIDLDVVEQMS